jgi:hypothetical protein
MAFEKAIKENNTETIEDRRVYPTKCPNNATTIEKPATKTPMSKRFAW